MSGGKWDYINDRLSTEIFGYWISTDRIDSGKKYDVNLKEVIKMNPLEDHEITAIVYDVLCLLHSYDWAISGDTDEKTYREDVKKFKCKWLKTDEGERAKPIIDICINALREELYKTFCQGINVADDIKEGLKQAIEYENNSEE